MKTVRFRLAVLALALLGVSSAVAGEPAPLTAETYAQYKAEIGPQAADAAWQRIDWLPSYREGLEAGSKQQKPILLWVMNGHPLGCT